MKVLVLWADSRSANLGVRVLAEGMAALARASWGADTEVEFQDFRESSVGVSFGGRAILRDFGRAGGELKQRLQEFDVILDSGAGDSFTDIYGMKRLIIMNYAHRLAAATGTPILMGPQTIGPFESRSGRAIAKSSMKRMRTIVARDSTSAAYADMLGHPVTALSTDVVFALPVPARGRERDVILNVSGLLWGQNPHVDSAAYRKSVLDLCRGLISAGRQVTLLPHVLANESDDNDVPAIREVERQFDGAVDVVIPSGLVEVREILAAGQVVVGSRMHACLNAISVGTPAISWAYSRKFAPLMTDLGWPHFFDLRTEPDPSFSTLEMISSEGMSALERDVAIVVEGAGKRLTAACDALSKAPTGRDAP